MSHTPGPWIGFSDTGKTIAILPAMRDGTICEFTFSKTPSEADASLMIAAPDLLKALRAAAGYLRNAHIDLSTGAPKKTAMATIDGGLRLVETAIAKAEGTATKTAE